MPGNSMGVKSKHVFKADKKTIVLEPSQPMGNKLSVVGLLKSSHCVALLGQILHPHSAYLPLNYKRVPVNLRK